MSTANAAKVERDVNTARWFTRNQVSDLLGVAVVTVIDWERKGMLHPKKEQRFDGRIWRQTIVIDPAEVMKLPRRKSFAIPDSPDELCSRAFEMFDQGRSVREIVIELRAHKEKIDALKQEWLDAGGCDLVLGSEHVAQLVRHVGQFSTVTELCDRVATLATREAVGRETIVADVPDGVSDAAIEGAINAALDQAGAP